MNNVSDNEKAEEDILKMYLRYFLESFLNPLLLIVTEQALKTNGEDSELVRWRCGHIGDYGIHEKRLLTSYMKKIKFI